MHSSHFLYSSPDWANLRGRQLGSRPPAAIPDHSLLPGLDDSARVMALWFGSSDQLRDDLHGVRIVYRDDHSAGARRGLSRKHQEDVSGTALVPGFVAAFARIVRLVFRATTFIRQPWVASQTCFNLLEFTEGLSRSCLQMSLERKDWPRSHRLSARCCSRLCWQHWQSIARGFSLLWKQWSIDT